MKRLVLAALMCVVGSPAWSDSTEGAVRSVRSVTPETRISRAAVDEKLREEGEEHKRYDQ